MEKLTTMDMYELCNKYQWFTHGTNSQYEKMFDFVRKANIDSIMIENKTMKLATMIWICSDDKFTIDDIHRAIRQKFADKNGLYI